MHWICRDDALIEYVCREYFGPLLHQHSCSLHIRIVIHQTAKDDGIALKTWGTLDQQPCCIELGQPSIEQQQLPSEGIPLEPSRFAFGNEQ